MMSPSSSSPPSTAATLQLRCRLFARYAELAGAEAVTIALPPGAVVADAVRVIRETVPNGRLLPERPLVAVNLAQVSLDQPLATGDELALLPPLAGG